MDVSKQKILIKDHKLNGKIQLYRDYGMCYLTLGSVGGLSFSGEYEYREDTAPNDVIGKAVGEELPIVRDGEFYKEQEATGFIG